LSSCWTLAIEEGTLENVACPSFACVKKRATRAANEITEPDRELVEEVVGAKLRDRWEDLKAKRRAEIGAFR
jgi:E3 ubiquitin-protein ligase RNF14